MTLSGAYTPGQCGSWIDSTEEVLRIPQSFSIREAPPSDCLVLYPEHLFGECYLSAEIQSMYSAAPPDWAMLFYRKHFKLWFKFLFKLCIPESTLPFRDKCTNS